MSEAISNINWLAVLVAAVANMVVGGLWYSPLVAAKAWMTEMNLTPEDMEGVDPKGPMIKSFIAAIILSFAMAMIIGYTQYGWMEGARLGVFMALLVVAPSSFPNYAFESRTMKHFLIHLGNQTIAMAIMGAILAAWR